MPVQVRFPDGSAREYPDGSTAHDVAQSISKGLAKAVIAAKVNGKLRDLARPLPPECELVLVKPETEEGLEVLRHSCSHLLAAAVRRLYGPDVKFAIGPPVEDGFYYDMEIPEKVSEEDLPKIEAEILKIIETDAPFVREDLPKEQAAAKMKALGQGYKLEILDGIDAPTASIYTNGDFVDLCEGPHVPSPGRAGALKLLKITGAYWRGDPKNRMLTRIYGTAWPTAKALEQHLKKVQEAKKRDHRKLGRDLELFMFHEWTPGSPFLLPRGTIIYNELLAFLRREYLKRGYQEVVTPQLFNKALWERSGHWEHFKEDMFTLEVDEEEYSLKPMNCPGHCLIYQLRTRSYRELPLRLADFCSLHRNELRGVLGGMTRVRKFSQDDAHIFCAPEQMEGEIGELLDFTKHIYADVFSMEYEARLSTRPAKAMGDPALWKQAEDALKKALDEKGLKYALRPGEGAFYGPKIDFNVKDALGREWQLATIQLDFQMPIRFGLEYVASDNTQRQPVMIHRAILGSLERFIGVLVEHYAGDFPLWLAPLQVAVLPVTEKQDSYAGEVHRKLQEAGLRSEIDLSGGRISYKIRARELQKVPYMAVVGAREAADGTVSVRERRKGDAGPSGLDEFIDRLRREVAAKIL